MSPAIPVRALPERLRSGLPLVWVAGRAGAERLVRQPAVGTPDLVGFLNPIHPFQVVLFGEGERRYLSALSRDRQAQICGDLCEASTTAMLVLTDDGPAPPALVEAAERRAVPLLRTSLAGREALPRLTRLFSDCFADRITLHGVFMEVLGTGVLLTGTSGIGKSELALALLDRGHRLIADDAPEFTGCGGQPPTGRCPEPLNDFLEVRGLGLINVRSMFGAAALREEHTLDLILNLAELDDAALNDLDRLHGMRRTQEILEASIIEITLPVAAGRNLATLVETAVHNEQLKRGGYDAGSDFIERQRLHLERQR